MATQADLRDRTLRHLRVVGQNQPIPGDLITEMDAFVLEVHESLFIRQLVTWDLAETPNEAVIPMMKIIAHESGPSFGMNATRMQALQQDRRQGEADLARLTTITRGDNPIGAEYY